MPKKADVAVILSGCGVYDGSEIHESVLTLLALARAGASVTFAAPDIAQRHVINHATGKITEDEDRNVLEEAARIARGDIQPIEALKTRRTGCDPLCRRLWGRKEPLQPRFRW